MQSPPGGSVRRRDFVTAIICLVSGLPFAVHAQQSTLVGYLGLTSMKADSYYLVPFRKALSDAGFDDCWHAIVRGICGAGFFHQLHEGRDRLGGMDRLAA